MVEVRVSPATEQESSPLRRLILCADDYGIAPGVNTAIRDLIARRRLNATSVMVVAPSFDRDAVSALSEIAAATPGAMVGLHLTLTAPFKPLTAFRPRAAEAFLPMPAMLARAMTRRLDVAVIAAEAEAQVMAFTAAFGKPPDFIDGHQHVHIFPRIRNAVLAVARSRAPDAWVRQCGGTRLAVGNPKALLLDLLSRAFRKRAETLGIRCNPAFAGSYVFDRRADFAQLFPLFLTGLPDGGLVMCHPGMVDSALERLDPLTHLREKEYEYLAGDGLPRALEVAGFRLF